MAPEVVYSPIVSSAGSRQRCLTRTPRCRWGCSPEMSEALTVAPEVVYSPIVPVEVRDKNVRPGHRDAVGRSAPRSDERRCRPWLRRSCIRRSVLMPPFATKMYPPARLRDAHQQQADDAGSHFHTSTQDARVGSTPTHRWTLRSGRRNSSCIRSTTQGMPDGHIHYDLFRFRIQFTEAFNQTHFKEKGAETRNVADPSRIQLTMGTTGEPSRKIEGRVEVQRGSLGLA